MGGGLDECRTDYVIGSCRSGSLSYVVVRSCKNTIFVMSLVHHARIPSYSFRRSIMQEFRLAISSPRKRPSKSPQSKGETHLLTSP